MDYMEDYWLYNSRYEILRNYATWCGISLIGACIHRQVYCYIGDEEIHGNTYVLLVGPQGNHKSYPCGFARKVFQEVRPNLEIGASTDSAEDIVKEMSKDEFAKYYVNELGEKTEIRPLAFFINEFKNFIAYNPVRMLNFLGDIYDQKVFRTGSIKRGKEIIVNASINILGCENPDQLIKFMKNDVMTGGMSRRFIMVYETGHPDPNPRPTITPDAREAWNRVKQRLKDIEKVVGCFKFTPEGERFYDNWYYKNHKKMVETPNAILQGYLSSKNAQLFKVCMALDVVSDKPMLLFTPDLLEHGLSYLNVIEENMPLLSRAAGRNDMLGPQQKMLEIIKREGGCIAEKTLMREIEGELKPFEMLGVIRHLLDTDQIIKQPTAVENGEGRFVDRYMIFTPEGIEELLKKKRLEIKDKKFHLMRPKV